MTKFMNLLLKQEQLYIVKQHDNSSRGDIMRDILAIHKSFSNHLKSNLDDDVRGKTGVKVKRLHMKYTLNTPACNVIQLAFLYMDLYLSSLKSMIFVYKQKPSIDIGLACYMLAYKYENEDNSWGLHDFVVLYGGRLFAAAVVGIEKNIWQNVLKFRVNLVTPNDFIDEHFYEMNITDNKLSENAKTLATKIIIGNHYYRLPSIIATMSLRLSEFPSKKSISV